MTFFGHFMRCFLPYGAPSNTFPNTALRLPAALPSPFQSSLRLQRRCSFYGIFGRAASSDRYFRGF